MVSLNIIRDEFAKKLAIKPRGLSIEEFNGIVDMMLSSISAEDEQLFARFDYWMRHEDRNAQIICANVELVRFGVLSARPPQESKRSDVKNSDGCIRSSSMARQSDIDTFLSSNMITSRTIKRLPETVETRAKLVDKWVLEQIDSKKHLDLLDPENIIEESNNGNQRTQSMAYISFEDLVHCISRSRNAYSLRDYAMTLMAIFKIYSEELLIAKDNAIEQKDDKIDELTDEVKSLKTMVKDQNLKIDILLKYGQDANQKLDDTNEKLTEMNGKLDTMFEFMKDFARMTLPMWIGSSVLMKLMYHHFCRARGRPRPCNLPHSQVQDHSAYHEYDSIG